MSDEKEAIVERRIRPLDKTVVNRIAAGEVIIAPSNALKEMLENSIDAKSTAIEISIKDGGLKLLQITDDGSGINKDDLPLLCERFATSKLTKFEDLQSISTYGFRGEALASISHISHLSVVTKTSSDECAWKCYYLDGKLVPPPTGGSSEPRAVAGRDGTSIIVEDLFYNVPSRLRTLRSQSEEYARIVDVTSSYAIHTLNVGFSCKKQGTNKMDLVIRSGMSQKDRIRSIYGSGVANELMLVDVNTDLDIGLNKCHGYVTSCNYTNKKTINQVYVTYLPKGHKPFMYLSLEIDPKNVDVNVHPTKREVRFLNEEEIIGRITSVIEEKLSSLDKSRTFLTQQVISTSQQVKEKQTHKLELQQPEIEVKKPKLRSVSSIKAFKRPYEKDMVRTDFNQSTLSSFVSSTYDSDKSNVGESSFTVEPTGNSEEGNKKRNANSDNADAELRNGENIKTNKANIVPQEGEEIAHITPTIVNLDSIKALRKEVKEEANAELTELFSKHTYVGVADYSKRLMCLQYDVRLYLMDYASVCNEFFYQVGLSDFSNFGRIRFTNPVDIRELLKTEIYDNAELMEKYYQDAPKLDDLINTVFIEMSEMLNEYFSIEIDKTNKEYPKLKTLPMLMQNYIPSFNKLSLFLFKIGTKVNWENEQDCLGGVLRQLALFYIPEPLDNDDPNEKEDREKTSYTLEDIIFPSIKKRFIATENLVRDVVEIANLPGLYKVFERC
ncbi:hypothetical protein HII12_003093 [Brettanomyces bruxellensis]|uniref:DNA mismatch repair protein S5 domain-containing protein n=1 Tax=Dekkera bruxellensis TaxID=5007 RepID=A0A8H6ETA0_DEKBR|nr:hypothetical protein HII12_003093 [Brettanomyces bruxellensis]